MLTFTYMYVCYIDIISFVDPTTSMSTPTSTDYPTPSPITTSTSSATPIPTEILKLNCPTHECTCSSGVLGLYRITLWIIVLTLTVLSTAITSLAPGFL